MKNFTKEYIKECDCYNIQILKPVIENYEWVSEKKNKKSSKAIRVIASFNEDLNFFVNGKNRANYIWLPTGDQLDEEIEKICKKKSASYKSDFYLSVPNNDKGEFYQTPNFRWIHIYCVEDIEHTHTNPLIAKIKLLKELLNENKTNIKSL